MSASTSEAGPSKSSEKRDEVDLTGLVLTDGRVLKATGGYSSVWLGLLATVDGTREKSVAIKQLRPVDLGDRRSERDQIVKRLEREIRVWKRLRHPNIVPLFGYALETNEGIFSASMVSPWYPNGNALEYLEKNPITNRVQMCMDIALGLRYLHENNPTIIHGDLKSANVLIDDGGNALICDFGLSIALDGLKTGFTSSTMGGSVRFLAPELLDLGTLTVATDIYAFGCVCVEIIYGVRPYNNCKSDGAVLASIERGYPPYEFKNEDRFLPIPLLLRHCWEPAQFRHSMARVCTKMASFHESVPPVTKSPASSGNTLSKILSFIKPSPRPPLMWDTISLREAGLW